jgi:hypothetical protein
VAVLRLTAIVPAALAVAVLAGGTALAAPGSLVTAPAGWRPDPEQEAELARRFAAVEHFGGLAATTAAEVHVPPRSGVALCATRATAALPDAAAAARAARAALDELRATPRRASLTGAAAEEMFWQERVDPDARQVTAILHWREPVTHTVGNARIVVASDGRRIAAVAGECLAGPGAELAASSACINQLASLDPGIAPTERVALAPAAASPVAPPARETSTAAEPPAAMAPAPDSQPPAAMAPAPDSQPPAPPRLIDGTRIVLPPMVIPQDRPAADRRPAFIGAGLIVLAVVFWWNRRRRDRFERSETEGGDPDGLAGGAGARAPRGIEQEGGTEPRGDRTRRRPARDANAGDLHAAARGDADADADDLHAAARGERPPPADDDPPDRSPRKSSP